jgi:AcrR family transcriptional regulator
MNTLRRNTPAAAATREAILDAAERLLARYGYKKTTMDDVAREAGIGKGTTYLHFPSKEELTLCTIDRIVDRLLDRLWAIARSGGPADRRLRDMLLTRVLFRFDSVRDYSPSLDDLLASLRAAYLARRQHYFDAEAEVFTGVLREGRDARVFAFDDPALTAHTLLWATNSLLPSSLSARELGKRTHLRAKAERVADLVLHGLLPHNP